MLWVWEDLDVADNVFWLLISICHSLVKPHKDICLSFHISLTVLEKLASTLTSSVSLYYYI